jgi:hypothetical protein
MDGDVDIVFSFVDCGFLPVAVEASVAVTQVSASAPAVAGGYGQPQPRKDASVSVAAATADTDDGTALATAATFTMRRAMAECRVRPGTPSLATLFVPRGDIERCISKSPSLAAAAQHARRGIDSRETLPPIDEWLRSPKKPSHAIAASSAAAAEGNSGEGVQSFLWSGLRADLRIRLRLVCADGQGSSTFAEATRVVAL